eukprot:TRINITY_DN3532_c0_g1_i1.p1 TRINITY_DN3532_c0_g1~~TRINITY_DN3532_c0_g1_i1.p1  ORF type:complete len:354 (+),score=82.67 TRINITY_DN3532_c0_g1_i1:154-1215(+)
MAMRISSGWKIIFIVILLILIIHFINKNGDVATTASLAYVCPRQIEEVCTFRFEKYVPSELETAWASLSNTWQDKAGFCTAQQKLTEHINTWIRVAEKLSKSTTGRLTSSDSDFNIADKTFSKFIYKQTCGSKVEMFEKWIEPLALSLKDPRYNNGCPKAGDSFLHSKAHLVLESVTGREKLEKFALMDIGASTFVAGATGSSQQYLLSGYKSRGIHFNKLLLWEPTQMKDSQIFAQVPEDWYPYYQYFNVLPSSVPTDPKNPLNALKLFATVDDFVSLKLTLNLTDIELKMILKMMTEPEITSLIDEFFYEHKFKFDEKNPPLKLVFGNTQADDIFTLLSKMRHQGIRAHGW